MITEKEYLDAVQKKLDFYNNPVTQFDFFSTSPEEEEAQEIIEQYHRENPIEFSVTTHKPIEHCKDGERMNEIHQFRTATLKDGIKRIENIYAKMEEHSEIDEIDAYRAKDYTHIITTTYDGIIMINREIVENEKIEIEDIRIIGFLSKMHMKYM